jgi:hypothetical protein
MGASFGYASVGSLDMPWLPLSRFGSQAAGVAVSCRQAVERLGERRRLRAWPGPARGRPVCFFWGGGRCAAWPVVHPPPKKKRRLKTKEMWKTQFKYLQN